MKKKHRARAEDTEGHLATQRLLRWSMYMNRSGPDKDNEEDMCYEELIVYEARWVLRESLERWGSGIDCDLAFLINQFCKRIFFAEMLYSDWGFYISTLLAQSKRNFNYGKYDNFELPKIVQPLECVVCENRRSKININTWKKKHDPTCSKVCRNKWNTVIDTLLEAYEAYEHSDSSYDSNPKVWTAYKFIARKLEPRMDKMNDKEIQECNGQYTHQEVIPEYTPIYHLFPGCEEIENSWWINLFYRKKMQDLSYEKLLDKKKLKLAEGLGRPATLEDYDDYVSSEFFV